MNLAIVGPVKNDNNAVEENQAYKNLVGIWKQLDNSKIKERTKDETKQQEVGAVVSVFIGC